MLCPGPTRKNYYGQKLFHVLFMLILGTIFTPARTNAQGTPVTRLKVSDCYSSNLVEHASESTIIKYNYFYLSLVNSENYENVKKEASVLGAFSGAMFDGGYKDFAERRSKYFELHNESLDYYYSQQSNVSFIPPEWKDTIQGCIRDTLNAAKFGVTYLPIDIDENKFRLELKYVSTEKDASSPYVKSSEITGGYVMNKGKVQRSLYSDCWSSWFNWACQTMNSRNEFIVIRDNPNSAVSVTLNLSNQPQSMGFDVEHLAKKRACEASYEGSPELSKEYGPFSANENVTAYTYGSDPNEVAIWGSRLIAPGKVTYVEVKFPKPGWAFMPNLGVPSVAARINQVSGYVFNRPMTKDPYWEDDTIWILGFKNGGDVRTFNVVVKYKEPIIKCNEIDWPVLPKQPK
jgi:hypothetical protein